MKIAKYYKQTRPYIVVLGLDALFFAFFSPTETTWVIIPALILVIATLWLFSRLFFQGINYVVPLKTAVRKRLTRLLVIALGLIVALQSIGQLTAKDVLTIVPLVAILYLYLAYTGTAQFKR